MNQPAAVSTALDPLQTALTMATEYGPAILKVLAIVIIGWIVALVIRVAVKRVLGALKLNTRVASKLELKADLESAFAKAAYVLALLVVLIAVASAVEVEAISGPIQSLANPILAYLPKLLGAGLLAAIAWVLATVARAVVTKLLEKTSLDDKLSASAGTTPISQTLGTVLHGVILLMFVPLILDTLGMQGLLKPVQAMFTEALGYVPNVIGAALLGIIGFFVARLVRDIVTSLLSTMGADAAGAKIGFSEDQPLSRVLGLVVYVLILIPTLVSALQVLQIRAITDPASAMLNTLIAAVPNLIAAGLILAIAGVVAKIVAPLAGNLAAALGADKLPALLGAGEMAGDFKFSAFLEKAIKVIIILFAAIEAGARLGLSQLSGLLNTFIDFGAQVLLGAVILVVGFIIARLAHRMVMKVGGENASALAMIARIAIIGLVLAMGLGAMGVADEIVRMAFGFTLGAVAVASALAFGLGGREPAGKFLTTLVERWQAASK